MVKRSILLTLHDREVPVILSTLRALMRAGVGEEEKVILIDDRSKRNFAFLAEYMNKAFPSWIMHRIDEEPEFSIDGFANPSRAFNAALELSEGDALWVMSSDTIVNKAAVTKARKIPVDEYAWTPAVLDLDTQQQYIGQTRIFPAPWFLVCSRLHALEVGGWDETYMAGMCYEDNDFIGRLLARTGAFVGDWGYCVYHNSHDQPAYRIDEPEIKAANDRNKDWTRKKWGGIPFNSEFTPFDILREMHHSGVPIHRVKCPADTLAKAIEMTVSPFEKAHTV